MVAQQLLHDVLALPLADRIDLLQRLRENLEAEASVTELSDESRAILDARLAEFEADETAGSSWEEVESRIRQRLAAR